MRATRKRSLKNLSAAKLPSSKTLQQRAVHNHNNKMPKNGRFRMHKEMNKEKQLDELFSSGVEKK
jgi:hypothetical protein